IPFDVIQTSEKSWDPNKALALSSIDDDGPHAIPPGSDFRDIKEVHSTPSFVQSASAPNECPLEPETTNAPNGCPLKSGVMNPLSVAMNAPPAEEPPQLSHPSPMCPYLLALIS